MIWESSQWFSEEDDAKELAEILRKGFGRGFSVHKSSAPNVGDFFLVQIDEESHYIHSAAGQIANAYGRGFKQGQTSKGWIEK